MSANFRIQEEREERHKYKGALKSALDEPELSKCELTVFSGFCVFYEI